MIILLDNLINNYLNILSCLVILLIINLNIYKFLMLFILDILLNRFPFVSLIILLLFLLDKLIFKKLYRNNKSLLIVSIINLILFMSIIHIINNYNFNYLYYLKNNIFGIIFNIIIYYIYIFYR